MKKYLIFFAFLASMGTAYGAGCTITLVNGIEKDSCASNSQTPKCDAPGQGTSPTYPKFGDQCLSQREFDQKHKDDYLIPQLGGGQNNNGNKENDVAPTCSAGKILNKEKTACIDDPCGGTLPPKAQRMTVNAMLESWTRNPQRAYPLAAGTTANGLRAGSGIVAGDQITCKHTPKYDAFSKCVTDNDPQKISIDAGRGFITEPTLSKLRTATAIDCAEKNGYRTVEDANKDYSCLKASVIDALWGFLTHRKPY
jgi:hypothetical protein